MKNVRVVDIGRFDILGRVGVFVKGVFIDFVGKKMVKDVAHIMTPMQEKFAEGWAEEEHWDTSSKLKVEYVEVSVEECQSSTNSQRVVRVEDDL